MTLLGIDHIVVIGSDLDVLAAVYREAGFTVTPGGKHPWGTFNALVPLADGFYIELLSFWTENHDAHRRYKLLQQGGGLIEFMLTSNNIASDIAAAKGRGAQYGHPVSGSRTRPNGIEVAWHDGPSLDRSTSVPSLIQDVTDRALRAPDGDARRHQNGIRGLEQIVVVVNDLDGVIEKYRALLGKAAVPTRKDGSATFKIGPHHLELRIPAGDQQMAAHLATFGDSPYSVKLYGKRPLRIRNTPDGAEISSDIIFGVTNGS